VGFGMFLYNFEVQLLDQVKKLWGKENIF